MSGAPLPPVPGAPYRTSNGSPERPDDERGGHRWLIIALAIFGALALLSIVGVGYLGYRAIRSASGAFTPQPHYAPATPPRQGCFEAVASYAGGPDVAQLAAGDVDGDRRTEVVGLVGDKIVILDQDGQLEAAFASGLPAASAGSWVTGALPRERYYLAIAHLQGAPAIVVACESNENVHAYRADGSMVMKETVPGTQVTCLATGDLEGDGEDEVLVGRTSQVGLSCLDSRGQGKWKYGRLFDVSLLAVGDATGDGAPEVYAGHVQAPVEVMDARGRFVRSWPMATADSMLAAADLDGDRTWELLGISMGFRAVAVGSSAASIFEIYSAGLAPDGTELWRTRLGTGVPLLTPVSVGWGDLDGDGQAEWVVSAPDGTLRVLDKAGQELGRHAMGEAIHALAVARPGADRGKTRVWVAWGAQIQGVEWRSWSGSMP